MTFLRLMTMPRRRRLSAAALALSFAVPFAVTLDRAGTGAVTAPARAGAVASARPAPVASLASRPATNAAVIGDARDDMENGSIETFAGPSLDGDPANGLDLQSFDPAIGLPFVTTDDGAIVFVARNQIFRIGTDSVVHRIGGTGLPIDAGDGGPAVAASFVDIAHLDLDASGNVVVTQVRAAVDPAWGPSTIRVRRIDATGTVTTIAEVGRRACPASVLVAVPTCVVKDARWGRDGSVYLQLGKTSDPTASPSPIDELNRIAVLHPGTTATETIAGNGTPFCPSAPSTGLAIDVAFCGFDVAPTGDGDLYAIQPGPAEANRRIVRIGSAGEVTAVAGKADGSTGDGVPALTAQLGDAHGLQITPAGTLFFAVSDGSACCTVRRISGGTVDTVAGAGTSTDNGVPTKTSVASAEFAVSPAGTRLAELVAIGAPARKVFRSANVGGTVRTVTGRTPFPGVMPRPADVLCAPSCGEWSDSIAIGPDDSVFVRGSDLFRIDADGNVTQALPTGLRISVYSAFTTAPDGTLFFVEPDPQSDTPFGGVLVALHPDGTVQRGVLLNSAHKSAALAADGEGNVYQIVGDTVVQYVDVNGFYQYAGKVAGGASCDAPTAPCAGADGQPAAEIPLFGPADIDVDSAGRLYIVETDGAMVRRVDANGTIHRVAGTGVPGTSGDGGQARVAKLERPTGISVGPFDWIYVADAAGSVVRRIKPNGLINTVAGDGSASGTKDDDANAIGNTLVAPMRLAVDSKLFTYVLDAGSTNVRRIAPGQFPAVRDDPPISSDSRYVPVPPTRILDTRSNLGGKGPVAAKGQLELTVTGAHGDDVEVPTVATAVVMNVTITDAAAPGYVQVFPTKGAQVGDNSNLNVERAGQTLPNLVVSRVGSAGKVTLYTQGGGQLVADLVGYFVPVPGPVSDGRYTALAPTRVLDTRDGLGQDAAHKPGAGESVKLAVLGEGGVPAAGVSAVVMNVTATEATARGFVQVIPTDGGTAVGASSNLNVTAAGQTIANLVIVPVGADGSVTLYTQNGTHLVADVAGWFTDGTADAAETGEFVPTKPVRLRDTRDPDDKGTRPPAGATVVVEPVTLVGSTLGMNAGLVSAVFANITATAAAAPGYVQGFPTGRAEAGSSSNLNLERRDQTIANAAVLTLGNGDAFTLFTQNGTHLVADMAGWFKK